MEASTPSRTALVVALMRSYHTRADPLPIIDDPWGDRLVPEASRAQLYEIARIGNPGLPEAADVATRQRVLDSFLRASPAYANVIVRTRHTEDALHRAVARGLRQYLLLGAGFDSYALRRPPEARAVTVIEVDHPATQSFKLQCMAAAGATVAEGVHHVAADLATQDLPGVLAGSPLRRSEPVFVSWLGVSMYLTREANLATLRAIATTTAPGSELVFSYFDQVVFEQPDAVTDAVKTLRKQVAAAGEPFVSGFHPASLAAELRALGLQLLSDRSDADLVRQHDPGNLDGLIGTERSRVAHVRVDGDALPG